jgi:hypothetical protein
MNEPRDGTTTEPTTATRRGVAKGVAGGGLAALFTAVSVGGTLSQAVDTPDTPHADDTPDTAGTDATPDTMDTANTPDTGDTLVDTPDMVD